MEAAVGRVGVSDWIVVSQAMIDAFAEATGDRQFIHVDPERARATPFGTTIAHGFLTLSLLPQLAAATPGLPGPDGATMQVNYGGNRVRFLAPVPSGTRIRGHSRLLSFAEKRPGQYQSTSEITVEIEGQAKPAMIAEWITQIFVQHS
ncbi:nodulation protein NodN [Sphingomonas sp. Leaf231]|nr:nodulation protein NodN [Sphingomonas sp. Leaf231]